MTMNNLDWGTWKVKVPETKQSSEQKETVKETQEQLENQKNVVISEFETKSYLNISSKEVEKFTDSLVKNEEQAKQLLYKNYIPGQLRSEDIDILIDLYKRWEDISNFVKRVKEVDNTPDEWTTLGEDKDDQIEDEFNIRWIDNRFIENIKNWDWTTLEAYLKPLADKLDNLKRNWIMIKDYVNAKFLLEKQWLAQSQVFEFISDFDNNGKVEWSDNGIISGPTLYETLTYWYKQTEARKDFSEKNFFEALNKLIKIWDNTWKYNFEIKNMADLMDKLIKYPELKYILVNGATMIESNGGNLFHFFEKKGNVYESLKPTMENLEKISELSEKLQPIIEKKLREKLEQYKSKAESKEVQQLIDAMLADSFSIAAKLTPQFVWFLISNVETRRGVGAWASWNIADIEKIASSINIDLWFVRYGGKIYPGIGVSLSSSKELWNIGISTAIWIFNMIPYAGAKIDYTLNKADLEKAGFWDYDKFAEKVNGIVGISTLWWSIWVGIEKDRLEAINKKVDQIKNIVSSLTFINTEQFAKGSKENFINSLIDQQCRDCNDNERKQFEEAIKLLDENIMQYLENIGYDKMDENTKIFVEKQLEEFYANKFKEWYLLNAQEKWWEFSGIAAGLAFVAGFLPLPWFGVKATKVDIKYTKDKADAVKDTLNFIDNKFNITNLKERDGTIDPEALENFIDIKWLRAGKDKNGILYLEAKWKNIWEVINIYAQDTSTIKVDWNRLYIWPNTKLNYYRHIDEKGNVIPSLFINVENINQAQKIEADINKDKNLVVNTKTETKEVKLDVFNKEKNKENLLKVSESIKWAEQFHESFSPDKNINNYIKLALLNFRSDTREYFEQFNDIMVDIQSGNEEKITKAKDILTNLIEKWWLSDVKLWDKTLLDIINQWNNLPKHEKLTILSTFSNITRSAINIVEVFKDEDWFTPSANMEKIIDNLKIKIKERKIKVADIPNWKERNERGEEIFLNNLDIDISQIRNQYDKGLDIENKDSYTTSSINNVIALVADYHLKPDGKTRMKSWLEVAGPWATTAVEWKILTIDNLSDKEIDKLVDTLFFKGKIYFENIRKSLEENLGIKLTQDQLKSLLKEWKINLDNWDKIITLNRDFVFFREWYWLDESIWIQLKNITIESKVWWKEAYSITVGGDGTVGINNVKGTEYTAWVGFIWGEKKKEKQNVTTTPWEEEDHNVETTPWEIETNNDIDTWWETNKPGEEWETNLNSGRFSN